MIRSIPTYFEKTVENHSAYFQQLFRDHYEPLCARAFQMVHDRKASEDIVQDVFLALWERREEVDFDRPLLPLLFVAVKNRAIDLLRSKKWRGGGIRTGRVGCLYSYACRRPYRRGVPVIAVERGDRLLHFGTFRAVSPGLPAEPHDGAEKPGDRRTAQHQCQDRREAYRLGIGKTPITARPQRLPATFPLKNGKRAASCEMLPFFRSPAPVSGAEIRAYA